MTTPFTPHPNMSLDEAHCMACALSVEVDHENRNLAQQAIASANEINTYCGFMASEIRSGGFRYANAYRQDALRAARELVALLDEE